MSTNTSNATSATVSSFVTALVLNGAIFAVEIAVFTLLRPRFKTIYSPRTFIPIARKRVQAMTGSIWKWPLEVYNLDYDDIRRQNGLDAYVFVRFLRMMSQVFFPMWLLSWAVLLPTYGVKGAGLMGLNLFTFGNVDKVGRLAAPIILVYIFTFWIFYQIKTEMAHFITVRQRFLIEPNHARSAQASTVLITGIPPRYLHKSALRSLFSILPGGVKEIWVNRDLGDLPDLFDARQAAISKLESAETSLLNAAAKFELKRQKAIEKGKKVPEIENTKGDEETPLSAADRLVNRKDRPTHRLPLSFMPFALPFVGQKVDTIEWAREEIPKLDKIVTEKQIAYARETRREKAAKGEEETFPRLTSAFVQFHEPISAHLAAQAINHHEPYRMADKYTEVAPADVIWGNLNLNPYEAKVRTAISYGITAALIIFWAIPVAFVGVISNVSTLCVKAPFLAWICKTPSVVQGIISGVLPPVLLAVLSMLLPIVLRLLARFEGIPRYTGLELSLMTRFFIFQVIHSFLIVTISSGIVSALQGISQNPTSIPTILAQKLPTASIFFLTFILLQLSGIAGNFLQIVPLIIYYVKLYLLGSTPRSVYNIKNSMRSVQWGTLFPSITLLVVIGLSYSVIQPIINGFACVIFFLMYQVYKYLFLYVLDQPPASDTGGLFFPKAITHVFVGLYVEQLCLCALFFLYAEDEKHKAVPQGALMVVLIVLTAAFHLIINDSYGSLLTPLPMSLIDKETNSELPRESIARQSLDGPDRQGRGDMELAARSSQQEVTHSGAVVNRRKATTTADDGIVAEKTAPAEDLRSDGSSSQSGGEKADLNKKVAKGDEDLPTFGRYVGKVDFQHPALAPAQIVWFPKDTLGLAEEELELNHSAGVDASIDHAVMNEKGTVDVSAPPPGIDLELEQ